MKKIAIIGAGISGLSCARLLRNDFTVVVYEKALCPGGLLRCERHEGSLFHTCGGHVFNTKNKRVSDWFWSIFNKENDFEKATRHSVVCLSGNHFVDYPIENHVYQLDKKTQIAFAADLLEMVNEGQKTPSNFDEFLLYRFGHTLYDLYFKPYNDKVWRRNLKEIPLNWLEGKLPMPTPQEMREANEKHLEENNFVHSSFYYPKKGGSQFIIDSLQSGTDIRCGVDVLGLARTIDGKWNICGETYDAVIYCGNIKLVHSVFPSIDFGSVSSKITSLESHGTTALFCQIDANPYSWIYQPNPVHQSHRCICTGNFASSNNSPGMLTGTIEFTDYISIEEAKRQLRLMPLNPRYIAHHYTPITYPIQHDDTRSVIIGAKKILSNYNVYLCGRFAEWEYFNMDVAINSAMQLADHLKTMNH